MQTTTSFLLRSPARIICSIFDHHLQTSKKITNHVREYRCTRCGEEMTDTAEGLLAKLTPRFRETNRFLAEIHRRRNSRKLLTEVS